MKKDKEWLKKEVIELKVDADVKNQYGSNYTDEQLAIKQIFHLINQLDEPEKLNFNDLHSGNIELVKEKLGSYGLVVTDKPVIPQFVANHIEGSKQMGKRLNVALSESPETEMILQMDITIFEANNIYARAWLDGYTIEKEPEKLHRVLMPNGTILMQSIVDVTGYQHWFNENVEMYDNVKFQFTEQEIKNIDERYWAFAEEVTE